MMETFRNLTPAVQVTVTLGAMFSVSAVATTGIWALTRSGGIGDLQWGQTMLLATTIAGFAVQAWREARNRSWAIDDRKRAADAQTADIVAKAKAEAEALLVTTEAKAKALHLESLAVAEKIRTETLAAAIMLREEQKHASEALLEKIDDVKNEAQKTYKEANHVNLKIEDLNKRILEKSGDDKKLEHLQKTADDVEVKVDEVRAHQKDRDGK